MAGPSVGDRLEAAVDKLNSAVERLSTLEGKYEEFSKSVAKGFSDHNKLIYFGLATILGVFGAMGYVGRQIYLVENAVTEIKSDVKYIKERTPAIAAVNAPNDPKGMLFVPALNDNERDFILKNMSFDKQTPKLDGFNVNDTVTIAGALDPTPDVIVKKIPQLQGTLIGVGKTMVLFVRPADTRVLVQVARRVF